MENTDLLELLKDPEILVINIDPASLFQKGHPSRCINIPLTRTGWIEDLKASMRGKKNGIIILSKHRISGQTALKLAEENHVDVKCLICGECEDLERRGVRLIKIPAISAEELRKDLHRFTVIDVREHIELVSGYIPGATHIPLKKIKEGQFTLDRGKKYATICAHGVRSRIAANALIERGYDATTVTGGMAIWLIKDFEVDYP